MTTLYPMRPTDDSAADSFMKDKILEPNEQMAKIVKDGKIYVLTLKEFSTSTMAANRSKETAEQAFTRREAEEMRDILSAQPKSKDDYSTWNKPSLEAEEANIKSRPKNAKGALANPNNASKLAKVRLALSKKGGTRKQFVMRSKKTRRHK